MTRCLGKSPTMWRALYRAYANDKLRRYKFARLDYLNLLRIVPGNFEAQLGLALVNQKDQHYTDALDGINRLVTAFPDSAVAWAARAGMEKERNQLELAEYDYTEALKRDPNNSDYLLERADIRIKLRKSVTLDTTWTLWSNWEHPGSPSGNGTTNANNNTFNLNEIASENL